MSVPEPVRLRTARRRPRPDRRPDPDPDAQGCARRRVRPGYSTPNSSEARYFRPLAH